ncbi:AbfB domain-containing protein [Paractinoplanes lichenicola]|uniref:AbfB domain-containing protein n=1 Tax=Paractinoplanes lichenicola TaxID=2802976 RepID=A0ABS1VWA8_9ACTN|nr:AbfB domain-containing protein [Actinoplanes lichenicola]MBL7258747.1 AbfB domain-containing protein [Actinoplanes lichenicola]
MPDEDKPEGLRIGGWVPPYRDTNGPLRPPVPPRRRGAAAALSAALWTGPIRRHTSGGLGRRAVAALATGAVIAVAGLTALALGGGDDDASLAQRVVLPPFTPSAPIDILPAPVTSSAGPGSVTRTPTRARATEAARTTTTRPATKAPTTRPATTAPTPAQLVPDRTVGLALADNPAYRLRHRDFAALLDDVDARSSRGARQDSRFTVRRGLASASCVSLESAGLDGYFLRHRNYELHLDRWDSSDLYQNDATFCPRPVRGGRALVLQSKNYPDYFLVARSSGVRIERVAAAQATAFVVSEPL